MSSPSGLWGNFGQSNYATAKMGIVGLSFTLAREGLKKGIHVNVLAPNAMTNMTQGIIPEDLAKNVNVKQITPVVLYLAHEDCKQNGKIFECGGGWVSQTRMQ